jgi:hypothetical protein
MIKQTHISHTLTHREIEPGQEEGGKEEKSTTAGDEVLGIPAVLDRLRAHDPGFIRLSISRKYTMMSTLYEQAKDAAKKADSTVARAHIMNREPLQAEALERKKAMFRAESAADAEMIQLSELKALSGAIKTSNILQMLQLFDCGIRASGMSILVEGLVRCASLTELDLSFNALDDAGGEHVAKVLESHRCSALVTLRLNRCEIRQRGTQALAVRVRRGPLRVRPLTLFGITLSIVTPKLNLPQISGSGWSTQKVLAFVHHELGGTLPHATRAAPVVQIGKTRGEVEAEEAAKAQGLADAQDASRKAAAAHLMAMEALEVAKQIGKVQQDAATQVADSAAVVALNAATVLISPEMIECFEQWDQAFERDFLDIEGKTYQQWQDSIIQFIDIP